ncbi:hypothetical protein Rumeso_04781 [Rubellimicrobium mesophilum DSM 19309]|uniref:Uncharacterized protein n=1 Tax=Rubellimicrobium mesophilum DSM 19309 TaxID=442562 RepID=A0A017HF14_9RHOB|nr:hypothetical protein Rumeso_04781 [Rubellimicrobium mesophilum DSM 19309]
MVVHVGRHLQVGRAAPAQHRTARPGTCRGNHRSDASWAPAP